MFSLLLFSFLRTLFHTLVPCLSAFLLLTFHTGKCYTLYNLTPWYYVVEGILIITLWYKGILVFYVFWVCIKNHVGQVYIRGPLRLFRMILTFRMFGFFHAIFRFSVWFFVFCMAINTHTHTHMSSGLEVCSLSAKWWHLRPYCWKIVCLAFTMNGYIILVIVATTRHLN